MPAEVFYDRKENFDSRLTYRKVFLRPPGLNADIQSTSESVNAIVDQDFELLGANAVSTCGTISTTGGCKITSTTGATDAVIILPHLDASQTGWATTLWDTAKSPSFESTIETGSSVATMVAYAGFKLTNTGVIATDDDSIYFRYAAADASGAWQFNVSRAGTDETYTVPTNIVAAVAASTRYRLRIEVYSDRTCMGFIDDKPIRATPFAAVTSLTTLIPYIGILNASGAAKNITVKYLECGRAY